LIVKGLDGNRERKNPKSGSGEKGILTKKKGDKVKVSHDRYLVGKVKTVRFI